MRITLNGFYVYDMSLFDGVQVPAPLRRDFVINEILKRGNLYPLFQAFEPLKENIRCWFERNSFNFTQLYNATHAEYNPLENYDRTEEAKHIIENSGADTQSNETFTDGRGDSQTDSEARSNSGTTNKKSAYNSDDFENLDKTETNNASGGSDKSKTEIHSNSRNTSSMAYGKKTSDTTDLRVHGNVGVTTSQAMALEEVRLRKMTDLYRIIGDMFEEEFLIRVY